MNEHGTGAVLTDANIALYVKLKSMKLEFAHATKDRQWDLIRQAYALMTPRIIEASMKRRMGRVSPYFLDWSVAFTPIEMDAWMFIRSIGVPLYPQYPADRFFLDFASPHFRIGLELDGAKWHDENRDAERDTLLARKGWRVFRIPGRETCTPYELPEEVRERGYGGEESAERAMKHWMMHTASGVITAIYYVYFRQEPDAYHGYCLRTLDAHRLVNFAIWTDEDRK